MRSPRPRSTSETLARLPTMLNGVARYNPLVWPWRWRYELALCIGVTLGVISLTWALGAARGLGVAAGAGALVGIISLWPAARHYAVARAWCIITPHRVRAACSEAWIHSRSGKLPIVLYTSRKPFGERVHVWCRPGVSVDDFVSARALLTTACWARDVHVSVDTRYAQLVILDVVRFTIQEPPPLSELQVRPEGAPQREHVRKGAEYLTPTTAGPAGPHGTSEGAAPAGTGGSKAEDPAGGGVSQARRRYLKAQCPESIPVGKPFSLVASIVQAAGPGNAELEAFDVPPEGREVLLVVHALGLRLLGDQRQSVHVPADGDSRPVMFELRADAPGPRPVSITAWIGGSYVGELVVEITAERDQPPGPHRDVLAEITTEPTEGAVSLVVRYDPAQNAYRFEFRDEDNPDEVMSNLAYEPGPLVEHLVADLDDLAKRRTGYSAAQTRSYLVNAGARLWNQLVPAQLREQFWDRQHRIRQLTILADRDAVPWELLYPMDPGHDAGFLVEQFPVTRAIFRWLPSRTLNLWPTRFVLPEGSLPEARHEIDAMRRLLDPGQPPSEIVSALSPLQDLIANGNFGLLHFACHNTYNPADGCSITLDNVQFTPTLMTTAAINKVLAYAAPTIFMNACRSAGLNATYNQLDGWANKFLEAGAAAFIGSLWAVSDGTAREFAQEFYGQLQAGSSLGEAVMRARRVAASQPDDPTWLAYTVYGHPRATISRQRLGQCP